MKKHNLIIIAIILVSSIFLIYEESQKKGFHEDEVYSVSSSVREIWDSGLLKHTDNSGNSKWLTKEEFNSFVTYQKEENKTFKSVYINQVKDVHPPFFYLLVHLLSIIIPSFWIHKIFILNFLFFLLTNYLHVKICKSMHKETMTIPTLIFYNFSIGMINTFTFQRMYGMLTFFALLYFYLHLKIINQDYTIDKKTFISLSLTMLLGFLTQYFFAIYAFFIFIIMATRLWKQKNNNFKKYLGAHLIAGILALLIFPSCFNHIFFGSRGVGSFGHTNYVDRFLTFGEVIKTNINVSLFVIIIFIIYILLKNKEKYSTLLTIPVIFYYLIITQIVPFLEIRYITLIIPFLILILVYVCHEEFKTTATIITVVIISIIGYYSYEPQFLYTDYQNLLNAIPSNTKCVFLTNNDFTYLKNLPAFLKYQETLIINNLNSSEVDTLEENSKLTSPFILQIESFLNREEELTKITDLGYNVKEKIYENNDYYLYLVEPKS